MLSAVRLTSLRYSKLNQSNGGRWAVPEITLRPHSILFSQQRSLLCWLNFCRSMDSGICYNLIPRWTLETIFALFVGDNSDKIIISGSIFPHNLVIYLRHGFFHPRIKVECVLYHILFFAVPWHVPQVTTMRLMTWLTERQKCISVNKASP